MEQNAGIDSDTESFFFPPSPAEEDDSLTLNIDGWEGPLDLLLALARNQKVDLREISILELVQQYLKYIAEAQSLKLELAADYLVMAAWRSEEHTSELQSRPHLVCRLLLEKKKNNIN